MRLGVRGEVKVKSSVRGEGLPDAPLRRGGWLRYNQLP